MCTTATAKRRRRQARLRKGKKLRHLKRGGLLNNRK